jgi:hypothetical protein
MVIPMAIRHATATAGNSRSASTGNPAVDAPGPDAFAVNFAAPPGAATRRPWRRRGSWARSQAI